MPTDPSTKPPREPKTSVGASITVDEANRLHALAEAKKKSLSDLVRTALHQAYPDVITK